MKSLEQIVPYNKIAIHNKNIEKYQELQRQSYVEGLDQSSMNQNLIQSSLRRNQMLDKDFVDKYSSPNMKIDNLDLDSLKNQPIVETLDSFDENDYTDRFNDNRKNIIQTKKLVANKSTEPTIIRKPEKIKTYRD